MLPRWVKESLDTGYEITHHKLVFSATNPYPPDMGGSGSASLARARCSVDPYQVRAIHRAVEAFFTYTFWTVYSVQDYEHEYAMEHLCPWGRQALKWHGLCTHNPLSESLGSDEGLTPEERAIKAATIYARMRERLKEWYAQFRDQKLEREKQRYQEKVKNDTERHKRREMLMAEWLNNKQKALEAIEREKDNNEARPLICNVCNGQFKNEPSLNTHRRKYKHWPDAHDTAAAEKQEEGEEGRLICEVCGHTYKTEASLAQHRRHTRHGLEGKENAQMEQYMAAKKAGLACDVCKKGFQSMWFKERHDRSPMHTKKAAAAKAAAAAAAEE